MYRFLMIGLMLAGLLGESQIALAKDVKGSADHPLIPRYAGSSIVGYSQKAFDDYEAHLGPAKRQGNRAVFEDTIDLQGKVTRMLYQAPKGRSSLEIFKNYEDGLKKAGYEVLYTCQRAKCGLPFYLAYKPVWPTGWIRDVFASDIKNQRYLAAKLSRPEGDVYAFLFAFEHFFLNSLAGPYVQLDTVDIKPIESNLVVLKADELNKGLKNEGRVPVYGIYFDTGKDVIKPDSADAIGEVVKLMKSNPDLKVHVVGHTDGVGTIDYNMDLSQRRARAVARALVNDHGIAENRLTAAGVGPLAPVASNGSDKGRSLNRRVELVEQYREN